MSLTEESKRKSLHPLYFLFAVIMWILVIGWLAVIFSLSSETAADSSLRSQDLVKRVASSFNLVVTEEFVRKLAHIFEYVVLSVLAYIAMFATNHIPIRPDLSPSKSIERFKSDNEIYIAVSLWITALSAAADEYNQIFVSGRSPRLFDVFLGLSGAFVLMMIIRIVASIWAYVKMKKLSSSLIPTDASVEEE